MISNKGSGLKSERRFKPELLFDRNPRTPRHCVIIVIRDDKQNIK